MSINFDLESGKTLKLLTAGKYCDRDIVVNAVGGGGNDIPSLYTKLKYITANGSQAINTGICANQDTRVVVDIQLRANTNQMNDWVFEGRNAANLDSFGVFCDYNIGCFYSDYGTSRLQIFDAPTTDRIIIDANKNVLTIGGASITHPEQTFKSNYPLYLFCMNSANEQKGYGEGDIYGVLVYSNNALARDYVPVFLNATSEAGLFDRVNHVFYNSVGPQPFIAGPVLAPQ